MNISIPVREKILIAHSVMPEYLGVKVGMLCVRGNVPLSFIGAIAKVSVPTTYRWVEGVSDPNSKAQRRSLWRINAMLEAAFEDGILPTEGKFDPAVLLPFWQATKNKK